MESIGKGFAFALGALIVAVLGIFLLLCLPDILLGGLLCKAFCSDDRGHRRRILLGERPTPEPARQYLLRPVTDTASTDAPEQLLRAAITPSDQEACP